MPFRDEDGTASPPSGVAAAAVPPVCDEAAFDWVRPHPSKSAAPSIAPETQQNQADPHSISTFNTTAGAPQQVRHASRLDHLEDAGASRRRREEHDVFLKATSGNGFGRCPADRPSTLRFDRRQRHAVAAFAGVGTNRSRRYISENGYVITWLMFDAGNRRPPTTPLMQPVSPPLCRMTGASTCTPFTAPER